MKINEIIQYLYNLSVIVHVEHANTKSFAKHSALGEFYDVVSDIKDRTVEFCIGYNIVDKVKITAIATDSDPIQMAKYAAEKYCKVANDMKNDTLINIAGEFEEAVGKLMFFFQLK